jgi:hypothetical protein
MTKEQMEEIVKKIENHTATQEEVEEFLKGYADLTEEIKENLKK